MQIEHVWNPTQAQADAIAFWLDTICQSRLDEQGGYPDAHAVYGGKLIVASIDYNGGPSLSLYTLDEAIKEAESWDVYVEDGKAWDADGNEVDSPYDGWHCDADWVLTASNSDES